MSAVKKLSEKTTIKLSLSKILVDPDVQPRVSIDTATVSDYAENVESLPPLTVFHDGESYYLADGWHRHAAYIAKEIKSAVCDVYPGDKRDAILYAVGSNAKHGLKRTNADKRRAVEMLLRDPEWSQRSDRWIAEACRVTHPYVADIRGQLETFPVERESHVLEVHEKRVGRDGKARTKPITTDKPKATGQSKVNGQVVDDPPDVAAARKAGRIAPGSIPEITQPEDPDTPASVAESIEETEAAGDDGLTDDAWLKTLPLFDKLDAYPRKCFARDALVYRRLMQPRKSYQYHFQRETKAVARTCAGTRAGDYEGRTSFWLRLNHPRDWLICPTPDNGGCGGKGSIKLIGECPKCRGRGFVVSHA